jgi:hypothetical protein
MVAKVFEGAPMKMFMRGCRYSLERPTLAFDLSYQRNILRLP